MRSDVVGHISNASILEAKTREFPQVPGQLLVDIKTKPTQNKQNICIGNFLYYDKKALTLQELITTQFYL